VKRGATALCLVIALGCTGAAAEPSAEDRRLLDILVAAYPDFLAGHDDGALVWKDGTRMPFDDGKPDKDFETRLAAPSLKDQFYARYATGEAGLRPPRDSDPGRVRYQPLFDKMYGDCRKNEVAGRLVDIVWLPKKWGRTLKVTPVNGVAERLKAISAELDALPESFDKYLVPPAGVYNCRFIAGTDRPSAHGTASAIDIATAQAHYWRWVKPDATGAYTWQNAIPLEIVAVFEKHGFIWGGKWHHFDTMHFEYRPEIIAAGK
jgi:hypothetical protein